MSGKKRFEPILWLTTKGVPGLQRQSSLLVNRLTTDQASKHWTALTPSKNWSRRILYTLVGIAGFGIVWASFARIDETVQGTGKLEPKAAIKEVKAPIGGVVSEILVEDGELVKKGQTLFALDTKAAKIKLKALELVYDKVKADLALSQVQMGLKPDLEALSENQKAKLNALAAEYKSRIEASEQGVTQAERAIEAAQAQLSASEEALALRVGMLRDIEPLVKQGAMARTQYLKEKQEVIRLEGDVKNQKANLKRLNAGLLEARQRLINNKALTRIDFSTKVEEGQKQIAELENQINETEMTIKYQRIKAPVNGIVFDLKPSVPGYVVSGNVPEPVVKIVPTDNLVARIAITNRDIGFIKLGQKAQVRVDAFPYNEFGDVKGEIGKIGSDVLAPDETYNFFRFPVTVDLKRNHLDYRGRKLQLLSGMSVTVNIILRQRSVISIFTEQIVPFWASLERL
jgi:hemolysin D